MSEADKKRKARKKAEKKAHVEGVKATGEAVPANVPGVSISPKTEKTVVMTEALDATIKVAKVLKQTVEAIEAKLEPSVNTTDALDLDKFVAVETPPEAELTEETEAVEDAVTEAVGPILEEAIELEKEPDKTPVEAEPEAIDDVQIEETTEETTTEETEAKAEPEGELSKEPEHVKVPDTVRPTEEPAEAKSEPSEISVEAAKRAAAMTELARLEKLTEIAKLQLRLKELGVK